MQPQTSLSCITTSCAAELLEGKSRSPVSQQVASMLPAPYFSHAHALLFTARRLTHLHRHPQGKTCLQVRNTSTRTRRHPDLGVCVWFSLFPVQMPLLLPQRRSSGGDTHFRDLGVSSDIPPLSSFNFLLYRLLPTTLKLQSNSSLLQTNCIFFPHYQSRQTKKPASLL